jgi:hypothetical protein
VAYEKASSEFDRIRSFLESHLQNGEHAPEEQTLARACLRPDPVRPSNAVVGTGAKAS